MGLAVFVELEPVLDVPHELIRRGQLRVFERREMLFVAQPGKREQRASVPHPRVAPAMQPLQALHQKLDIADAAARQFHVRAGGLHLALLVQMEFLMHARPRFRNRFHGPEIDRRLVNQRLDEARAAPAPALYLPRPRAL